MIEFENLTFALYTAVRFSSVALSCCSFFICLMLLDRPTVFVNPIFSFHIIFGLKNEAESSESKERISLPRQKMGIYNNNLRVWLYIALWISSRT